MPRILLVEDEPCNRAIIEDLFEFDEVPAELICAASAEQGLEIASDSHLDLILMDLRLPDMDGLEATRRLKSNESTAGIPVWAVTANAMKGDSALAYGAGCSDYISKPFDIADLARRLRDFLLQSPRG